MSDFVLSILTLGLGFGALFCAAAGFLLPVTVLAAATEPDTPTTKTLAQGGLLTIAALGLAVVLAFAASGLWGVLA